jgi:hypothetical protein
MTMPNARRLARRNVALLVEMGLTKADAARVVQLVCDEVTGILWRRAPDMDCSWLAAIYQEAATIGAQAAPATGPVADYAQRVAEVTSRWGADSLSAQLLREQL